MLFGGSISVQAATGEDQSLHQMKKQSHGTFNISWDKHKKAPTFISGNLSSNDVLKAADVKAYLEKHHDLYKVHPNQDLILSDVKTDELGMKHYTFLQTVKGVKVDQAELTVHVKKDGTIASVSGKVYPQAKKQFKGSAKPKLSKGDALEKAWQHIDVDKSETKVASKQANSVSKMKQTVEKGRLVVYPHEGASRLAYHVELQFIKPYGADWQVYVDAKSGKIVNAYNAVKNAATTGSGYGVLGKKRSLNTYYANNQYYLRDMTKPMSGVIRTTTADYGTNVPGYWLVDEDGMFNANDQSAAVSAHYNAGVVYDYYYNNFDRNSYDGNGSTLTSTVHYSQNYNNAFWNGNQMVYGDGDGTTFIPLSGALDVVAHELTHAVTDTTAQLVYQDQSGALNESFSDVFGTFIEGDDYLMGEDVYTPNQSGDALRSLAHPAKYGQPEHMDDYVQTSQDNGGVHTNSGIPNKAAYNTLSNMSWDKAEQIYYRALTVYLSSYSDFSDARAALLQAAADLYGYNSEYQVVANAWNQVGVN
ncbi:M4 family metallopeptidase [Tuberibacillus sp. Marseille-P3662]|uniref:M4 family metallopeptidase n=1 Tax=Tuberibacillus sp. Marseille-P3662 TaxID=1965358 RepID=UPI000A1C9900